MKKIVIIAMMFTVSIFANSFAAKAQVKGSGMFSIAVQYEKNSNRVKDHIDTAVWGSMDAALHIYRNDLKHISGRDILDLTVQEMANQFGAPFDVNHPEYYRVEYDDAVSGDIFDEWEDSYLIDGQGAQFFWGDPRDFPINKGKSTWAIYTITDLRTGKSVKFRANCGNIFRPKHRVIRTGGGNPYNDSIPNGRVHIGTPPPAVKKVYFSASPAVIKLGDSTVLSWNTQGYDHVSVTEIGDHLDPQGNFAMAPTHNTTYWLTAYPGAIKASVFVKVVQPYTNTPYTNKVKVAVVGGGFWHSPWPYVLGAVVVGGVTYAILQKTHDNNYNNKFPFQDGSNGPGTDIGGSGGQQSWAQSYTSSVAAPRAKFVVKYVIHF